MRLQRLTGLEHEKIKSEYNELYKSIERFKEILTKEPLRMCIIKEELCEIKEKFKDKRRTLIEYSEGKVTMEDLIANKYVVLTISHAGYIKRTPLSEYKRQSRGGVGNRGARTREEDFLEYMLIATNHQFMLFFTEKGKCFWLRVYEIPEGLKTAKGRAIQNLIQIRPDDKVKAFILTGNLNDAAYIARQNVVMITQAGIIKKTSLEKYSRPRQNGINAIKVREGDTLLEAKLTSGKSQILIAIRSGKIIRFPEEKVRVMGRATSGVIGVSLKDKNDKVVGMVCVEKEDKENILVVSEKGYGKRSYLKDYRITNRGGKGVKTINITEKTGELIAIKSVSDKNDLMIINKSGLTIRMPVSDLRVMGRATQGVRLIDLRKGDKIASVAKVIQDEELNDQSLKKTLESQQEQ